MNRPITTIEIELELKIPNEPNFNIKGIHKGILSYI